MAELKESSLLFSLQGLFARERERVDLEEEAARAELAEHERRRQEAAAAEQREQERLRSEREAREREHAAYAEALKHAEIERVRARELAGSEAALLRARLDDRTTRLRRVERKARRWAALACAALGAGAAFGAFYSLSARPQADATERELEQRLALERQRSREIGALLERANQRWKALSAVPALDLIPDAPPPALEPVPPPRRPRGPARTRPREVTPCLDNRDPLNPCLP